MALFCLVPLLAAGCVLEAGVGVAHHTTVKSDGTRTTSTDFDSSPDGNPATREYHR
ncbi:MAG: hypothetical protein AAF333_16750 [Planctomycetota bacterium]